MMYGKMAWLMLLIGLIAAPCSQASDATIETPLLVVSDASGSLSGEPLKRLADTAQATLNKVIAFWSADPGIRQRGKIKVIFDKPRRDVYSSVFYWEKKGSQKTRVVRVFGSEGEPQMLAHKLTSAVLPQEDKLIRNLMGILTEAKVGNPLTFPLCGFDSDEWVLAFTQAKRYIPLSDLGPDHESWGMSDSGGGNLSIHDKARQHVAYAEAGSFGNYLFRTYGVAKIKHLQRISHEKARPWKEVFGIGGPAVEAAWLETLKASGKANEKNVSVLLRLFERNPADACAEAQKLARDRKQ